MIKLYLAIPYTGMEESSYEQANKATVELLRQGFNVFSPITHSHPLAKAGEVPGTWDFWSKIDYQFIDWCDEVVVFVPKEGIDKVISSIGVLAEVKYALKNDKRILWITENNIGNIQKIYYAEGTKV